MLSPTDGIPRSSQIGRSVLLFWDRGTLTSGAACARNARSGRHVPAASTDMGKSLARTVGAEGGLVVVDVGAAQPTLALA